MYLERTVYLPQYLHYCLGYGLTAPTLPKKCPVCPVTAPQYCPSALFLDAFYPLSICSIVAEYVRCWNLFDVKTYSK